MVNIGENMNTIYIIITVSCSFLLGLWTGFLVARHTLIWHAKLLIETKKLKGTTKEDIESLNGLLKEYIRRKK
jgi:hypothetical protein|tara:strand:+ start:2120 stop:2338 length:219 start_codon:yes stop_codon:yes gene_type:complete